MTILKIHPLVPSLFNKLHQHNAWNATHHVQYEFMHSNNHTCTRTRICVHAKISRMPHNNRHWLTYSSETLRLWRVFFSSLAAVTAPAATVGYWTANKFRLMIIRYCLWFQTCWCVFGCTAARAAFTTATSFSLRSSCFCFPSPYYSFKIIVVVVAAAAAAAAAARTAVAVISLVLLCGTLLFINTRFTVHSAYFGIRARLSIYLQSTSTSFKCPTGSVYSKKNMKNDYHEEDKR